jgi:hypothetical protein
MLRGRTRRRECLFSAIVESLPGIRNLKTPVIRLGGTLLSMLGFFLFLLIIWVSAKP